MNTSKLRGALKELQDERAKLDKAVAVLKGILAELDAGEDALLDSLIEAPRPATASYVDLGVAALEKNGRPMHIKVYIMQPGGRMIAGWVCPQDGEVPPHPADHKVMIEGGPR